MEQQVTNNQVQNAQEIPNTEIKISLEDYQNAMSNINELYGYREKAKTAATVSTINVGMGIALFFMGSYFFSSK